MIQKLLLSIITLAILAACDNGTPKNSTANTSEPSTSAETLPVQNIIKNNILSFLPDGDFVNKLGDSAFMPADIAADSVTLLQYDVSRNLTVLARNEGKAKDAAKFLSTLKTTIENSKDIQNVKVGEIANNQLTYSFSHDQTNESCISHLSTDSDIYTVCASSNELSTTDLQTWLEDSIQFH